MQTQRYFKPCNTNMLCCYCGRFCHSDTGLTAAFGIWWSGRNSIWPHVDRYRVGQKVSTFHYYYKMNRSKLSQQMRADCSQNRNHNILNKESCLNNFSMPHEHVYTHTICTFTRIHLVYSPNDDVAHLFISFSYLAMNLVCRELYVCKLTTKLIALHSLMELRP